jgi:hypothetical protein
MGYVIHFDDAINTIITVVEGDLDVPLVNQFAQESFAKGAEHQCTKYLVDIRDTEVTDTMVNIAEFALRMEQTGIKTEFHIAVVIQRNENEHNLFSAMSKNRGYARLRYFRDIDAAHTWLYNLS